VGWSQDDWPLDERARREAENGIAQARRVSELIRGAVSTFPFSLTPALLCELNDLAVRGVVENAGKFRQRSDVEIAGSNHVLPPHDQVPALVKDACAFVNGREPDDDPLLTAAFIVWRICWIHPFDDGNGRTARAASYLVLSVRLGGEPPGDLPIPARIKHAPIAYARALEAADAADATGRLDVSAMRALLDFYLDAQLNGDPPLLPPGA
jgi:Fic family protein